MTSNLEKRLESVLAKVEDMQATMDTLVEEVEEALREVYEEDGYAEEEDN